MQFLHATEKKIEENDFKRRRNKNKLVIMTSEKSIPSTADLLLPGNIVEKLCQENDDFGTQNRFFGKEKDKKDTLSVIFSEKTQNRQNIIAFLYQMVLSRTSNFGKVNIVTKAYRY